MSDDRMKSYLKERLGSYEHPVDDTLWSSLNRKSPRRKNKLRRAFIAACAGAAAIALGLFTVTLIPTGAEDAADTPLAEDYRPAANPAVQEGEPQASGIREIAEPDTPRQAPKPITSRTTDAAENIQPEPVEDKSADTDIHSDKEEKTSEATGHDEVRPVRKTAAERYPPLPPERRSRRNKDLSVLLAVNGAGSVGKKNQEREYASDGGPLLGSDGKPIEIYDPFYDFPINLSLTVRKGLSGKFAVETGLTYSYLHTTDSQSSTDIKLHYLGIPLKGIYTLYDNRRISLYTAAGGVVERQVAGRLTHQSGDRNLVYSGLQWSVNASAGVNLRLGNHVGLFAEPGVAYFFDDGSNIPTIRKKRPFNFNLQIGLRFNIDR